MTTPDPALVSLLIEAFEDIHHIDHQVDEPCATSCFEDALAHPRLARALAIGEAWLAAEAALTAQLRALAEKIGGSR